MLLSIEGDISVNQIGCNRSIAHNDIRLLANCFRRVRKESNPVAPDQKDRVTNLSLRHFARILSPAINVVNVESEHLSFSLSLTTDQRHTPKGKRDWALCYKNVNKEPIFSQYYMKGVAITFLTLNGI